ncbi:MAG: MogA/MoaB family molybdenum cofactor biosynthesis protein [Nitrospirae bacterium]|nr:MAG: MogA/MoaB family molybdenum cofactor biosynthesis protein [Nitrospirota bacterium]
MTEHRSSHPDRQKHAVSLHHRHHADKAIGCVVITCSDTRSPETDTSGALIRRLLEEHGHNVIAYYLLKDEPTEIRRVLENETSNAAVDALIINGGTGISRRDSTFEAIDAVLEKRLDGFGELFRYLSYKEIGSAAMLSRATAGLYRGRVVFSLPGSESAVKLAMQQLILPEIGHIVAELHK